ncbi:MAG: hypothetical protein IJG18_08075 [Kiritimatiellae bacterium]|nr:hypothetical protein [Kiritimatiellia bacterium]
MKNIIERIAGGAKIARYLPKAVSTRLAVAALAALAAGGAWAADSLEETGGALSAVGTDTLAFKGVTLSELTSETLHGRMSGDWAGTAATKSFTFNNFDRSNEGSGYITCQAQLVDDGWLKGMVLKFTQSGDDINAQIVSAGSVNGGSIGGSVAGADNANSHYVIYNLSLTRSWSDSAVVIWEAGQFGVTSKTGSDGNTYTLNANGNSVAANASSITINQSVGVKVDSSAALTSGMTVLVRYSDLNLSLGSAQTLVNSSIDSNGTATGDGNGNRTGVYIDNSGASQGLWAGKTCISANGVSQTSHTFVATETSGVMAFSYYSASTTDSNLGTHLWYLSNGTRSALYNLKTLGSTSDSSIYGCVIGGPRGSTTNGGPATGMKITGIAIFKGVLSESQMTSFIWPSAVAAEYAKWSYASYVLTCNSGFSNFESPNYSTFDLKSGYDIMPTYTTSVAPVKWQCFGYSNASGFDSTAYAAPGNVLRFVNASHACIAKFSPLTLGGMIVEPTATGCSLAQSEGSRSTILGDPTANAETWFKFDTGFSMARTGAYAIMGTVNLEINNSASVTFSGGAQISGASEKAAGANPSHTAGGVLKLHGNGSMAISSIDASDATLDYTDLPATVSSSSDAFIQGSVTVDENTVFALPEGVTFPYFVATGISGVLDSETGVTIGGVASPNYVAKSDGSIIYSAPAEVTISSDATWGSGDLDGWATDDSTKLYVINVTANSTLTLPSAISLHKVTFNVSEGVVLTLSGAYTITATEAIHVNGSGKVITAGAGSFSGIIKGNGTVQYPSKTLPTGATWTNNEWEGTLIIVQCGKTNNSSHGYIDFASYGSVNSFIKATSFAGYTTQSTTANATYCAATLVIDEGDTFTLNNGDGSKSCVFKALTGSGTLALTGSGTATTQYIFRDVTGFTGTVTISDNAKKSIVFGASSSWTPNFSDYQKKLVIAGDVTIASGKTWTANGGIVNSGTMTLNGSLSGTVTGSGTVVCGQSVDLSGSGFDDSVNWTGTVRLNGDTGYLPSTFYDESSYGNASSTLEIASGLVAITTATSLPGTVNVAESASLYVTSGATELTLAGSNSGTVNLQNMESLTTLTLNLIVDGTIMYPSSLTTLNVIHTESLADDGVKTFSVTGATFTSSTMTLTRPDGTTESVTGTVSGNTLTFAWTPSVSGAACWCAYEMEYDSANNKTGFENSGSDNTALSSDGVTGSDAFTDDGMLYTYAHPWRNMTDDNAYPSSWTAVVRCTVPAYENAAVITFGTYNGGLIGLVAGADPETQMKLVKTTGNSAFTTLATMTVQNATTAQHVYVFSVENNQTIKVYCDGEQVLNETYSTFTLGGGIQVGSVHGGIQSTGIVRFAKDESPANDLSETVQKAARIDCVRLYKTALGPNAIAQLSVEFPAVKLYRATVAANATTTWDALTWSPTWDGGNEYSKIILTTEGDATLTLPDSITADEFTINVASDSTLTLAKAAGGTEMTISKLEINDGKVAVSDANFFGSRVINGTGTLKITATGALTSALSGNAKVEIPSGVGVGVMSGGSIANAITGAGELAYQNPADVLATSLTFSAWTGTVSLPIVNASNGVNFNNYGTTGSTVALAGMTGGYILEAGKTVNPTLRLDGAMNITAMSTRTYTFAEITGTGNLSFSTSANSPTVAITKVAEGYSGMISSTLETPVTIATLDRAAGTSTAGGTKLLSTSGNVAASALTVGGAAQQVPLCTAADGIYVACTVTIPDVENASATVTVGCVAGSSPYTVDVGSNVEITWTAASGYKITDGATQTINAIATDVTATAPTVEAKGATVSDVAFDYGKDFATATVTATVSGDATAYTLTVDGTDYPGTVDGTTVTFSNVVTGHSSAYDSVSYEIAATDGTSSVVVSGGSGAAPVADVTADWINERAASATGTSASASDAGGAWTNAVTYTDGTAAISDNRFVATAASTASRVLLEFTVCFSSTSADDVSGEAQAAIKLGEVYGATTFMVLTNANEWAAISNAALPPDASETYMVVLTIDYESNTYGVTVNGYVMKDAANSESFPLAASKTSVQTIDFAGSGTLTSMKGDQVEGYMVVDKNGMRYPSIAAAISAYTQDPSIGPLKLLHSGTPPSGWRIDGDTLIKVAKGLFFMAF